MDLCKHHGTDRVNKSLKFSVSLIEKKEFENSRLIILDQIQLTKLERGS